MAHAEKDRARRTANSEEKEKDKRQRHYQTS